VLNFLAGIGVHWQGDEKDIAGDVVAVMKPGCCLAAEGTVRVGKFDYFFRAVANNHGF